jgi:glycosyltransferase involved in cell wall biosynthesis
MNPSSSLPLVSICIPAYNAAGYIDETINSVLGQTYRNIELVIVNDGSKDATAEVLKKYETSPTIRIIHSVNKGQCASMNLAVKHSGGEFIKFLDADDILNDIHIESMVRRLLDNPNCIAAGQVKRFYNDDISTALHEPLATWQDLKPMDWMVIDNGKGLGMMSGWLFLIPRHLLDKAGPWNENLLVMNDYEFSPRLLLLSEKVLFVEDAKIFYRSGMPGSISNMQTRANLVSAFTGLEATESFLLQHENSERVKAALSVFWHLWAYSFFLDAPDLYKKAKKHLKQLGNHPNIYFDNAPGKIMRLIGWKNHKRIKKFIHKLKLG